MAKSKDSAARRREQQRNDRQRRMNSNTSTRQARAPKKQTNTGLIIGISLIVVVFFVALFVIIANQQKASTETATPDVFKTFTSVSPTLLSSVGTGSASDAVQSLVKPVKDTPILKGPSGKPEVFYMGADFCPYCGSQRYALIVALSRFGSFDKPLAANISGESSVPTYTFHNSTYTSKYLDFVPVEVKDNQGNDLQKLTTEQQALVEKYDAPPYTSEQGKGAFPFTNIGNQYVVSGAMFPPELLIGKTHEEIAKQMEDPASDISRGMLGSANYLTAMICKITANQPAEVCGTDSIKQLQQQLPTKTAFSDSQQRLLALAEPPALNTRRQD